VVSHGLLGAMTVVEGLVGAMLDTWDTLDDTERQHMLKMVHVRAQFVSGVLSDLARGLSPDAADSLTRSGQEPAPLVSSAVAAEPG
jgi:hypothetical protein